MHWLLDPPLLSLIILSSVFRHEKMFEIGRIRGWTQDGKILEHDVASLLLGSAEKDSVRGPAAQRLISHEVKREGATHGIGPVYGSPKIHWYPDPKNLGPVADVPLQSSWFDEGLPRAGQRGSPVGHDQGAAGFGQSVLPTVLIHVLDGFFSELGIVWFWRFRRVDGGLFRVFGRCLPLGHVPDVAQIASGGKIGVVSTREVHFKRYGQDLPLFI